MKIILKMTLFFYLSLILVSCSSDSIQNTNGTPVNSKAKIISVTFSGTENNYNFSVGITSPDKGCEQFANWWEVITEDGSLIYRRILLHSHVDEQPFIRSGGPVKISKNQTVIVRVHMNNTGYSVNSFKGSVSQGFKLFKTKDNFVKNLENVEPLPKGCAF